jgi:sugar transferase (PEP-CTERM/EpsH1 system associated)
MSKPRVLFLAHLLPWPLEGGGQIKSYHVLRQLAQAYDIKLLALIRKPEEAHNAEPLRQFCALGIETIPLRRTKLTNLMAAGSAVLTGRSFIVSRDHTPALQAAVERELATGSYTALHVDHLQMAAFVPPQTPGIRVILDQHNVEYRIPQRIAQTAKNPAIRLYGAGEWKRLRRFEQAALRRADLTLAVSDEDRQALQDLAGAELGRIETLSIGVDTDYFSASPRTMHSKTLVSIGTMYWPPNIDAISWFCREILPKIREREPEAKLMVVGARPTAEILALAEAPAVTVTGSVPDVRPYGTDCGAFIVPLRSGSGMRVKILNALAMGLPTVSTTIGAEGIEVTDGEDILLADTAEDFAAATLRLLSEPVLAARLAENGRKLMEERYGWDAIGAQLRQYYAEALAS